MRRLRDTNLLWTQMAIVVAMLAWTLRASFFSGAYSERSQLPAHWLLVVDAGRPERMLTILAGFAVALFGVPIFVALRELGDKRQPAFAHACLQVTMVALGGYAFPYFGLGVTHAYAVQENLTAYDPLRNPPGMLPFVGDLWYLTALLAPQILMLIVACMALVAATSWKESGWLARTAMAVGTATCLLLPFVMPNYFAWIWD